MFGDTVKAYFFRNSGSSVTKYRSMFDDTEIAFIINGTIGTGKSVAIKSHFQALSSLARTNVYLWDLYDEYHHYSGKSSPASHKVISEGQKTLFKLLFPRRDGLYSELLLPQEYKQLFQLLSFEEDEQEIKTLYPENYHKIRVLREQLDLSATTTDLREIINSFIVTYVYSYSAFYKCAVKAIDNIFKMQPLLNIHAKIIVEDIYSLACQIWNLLSFLTKLLVALIRLQVIAYQIRSRTSRSPTPQKKEPPVGGVKTGGKQHDISRHVAKILYPEPIFILNQAAMP
jgi:hypothetical protein